MAWLALFIFITYTFGRLKKVKQLISFDALRFILRCVVNITIVMCLVTSHFAQQLNLIHGLRSILAFCEISAKQISWIPSIIFNMSSLDLQCSTSLNNTCKNTSYFLWRTQSFIQMHDFSQQLSYVALLKTLDTIGNCLRLVFTVGVTTYA